ncbi:capsid cement protein [Brevibacterium sp.]|uniref:capsid cement protein n=1 Tax=Brevibacterium sp. TaxID=1701 RepID=UPI0028123714|nr:capsid cement protein [Brevibacterium sp.]
MSDYSPLFYDGDPFTCTAATDVTGGRLVTVAGNRTVGHAAADSNPIGVAAFDAKAGESVNVIPGGVHRPAASGAIAAGARVAAAAGGTVSATGTNFIGTALTAAADGELVEIKLDH